MKGMVVYYSKWGNCEQIAEAIHKGLVESGHYVSLNPAGEVKVLGDDIEFVAAGGPTRIGRAAGPIRRFVKREAAKADEKMVFAAFGTGMNDVIDQEKPMAADRVFEILKKKGHEPLLPPFRAAVTDMKGPLAEGEVARAFEFGRELGKILSGHGE